MPTDFRPDRLIVKFKPSINADEINSLQAAIGVTQVTKAAALGIDIWQIPEGNVEQIIADYQDDPRFEYIEPDYIITLENTPTTNNPEENLGVITPQATTPNDPSYSQLWGLNNTGQSGGIADADIDAPEAWDIQKGNQNLVIGVIDTGVDYNHPDLAENIWTNPGEIAGDGIDNDNNGYIDDVRGWDFANNDNNPMDGQGHGTHVAGTIAGKGNNGVGVTGVAWNAKIMPLKFLSDSGLGSISNAILAINYATVKGVQLTNNSWGGGGYSQALYDAINTAGQQGALFVAAAGNSSQNTDTTPAYPASYDLANIISVASTTRTDGLSSFSNYGATTVDLGAPGSDIYSTWPNSTYNTISGTSMASPHVTGAAALLWSQNPTWTAQQIKTTLMSTGDSISALNGKTVSGKRLNIYNALAPSDTTPPTASSFSPTDNATGVAVGANLVVNFSETIQKGTGNIVIKKLSDNSVVETIAITGSNVTASGSQLTINPTADLAQNTGYYIEIANGTIKDIAGNNYAGITGNSTWNFQTAGSSVVNDNFANRAVLSGVPVSVTGSNVGATGESGEPIQSGTTNSVWWSWTAPSSGTFTIDTKNSSFDTYLSIFTGSAVNNLSLVAANDDGGGNLTSLVSLNATAGTTYQIAVDGYNSSTGAIQLNIASNDITPPTANSFSPTDNATGVAVASNLVVNFSEAIQKGTGNIVIKKLSDNSVVETIAITGSNVTASGSQLTINPTNDLAAGTGYYVEIANGAIKDIAGNNYAGITGNSAWNFTTTSPSSGSFTEDTTVSLPGVYYSSVAWADYTGDGKQDFLLTGYNSSSGSYISKLYRNTGNGFSEDTSVSLPGVYVSSVAWADYNGDGKQDFLLTGYNPSSGNGISKLYKNTGNGFTEDTSVSLPGVYYSSVAWADYNGDSKQDFLLTGYSSSGSYISKLYKNTGNGFSEDTSVSLPGVYNGSVAWADYTGDGKQDFLLTGYSSSGSYISKLYKNTGNGFTEDTSVSLPGVYYSSVAWADYNGDSKQDFLLTGYNPSSGSYISKLYKNTGNGFSEDTSVSLPGVHAGSVAWADYTGDGKQDFLLTGYSSSGSRISKLYKNTGNGFSEDTSVSLPGVEVSSVAWADYTGDGTQDFLLTGYSSSGSPISKLYKNTATPSDITPPTASSFSPTDNATGVAVGANLVVNFSEAIQKGTGNIVIKKLSDNSVVETIAITGSNVTASGSQLTINPTNDLAAGTDYYVEIANGAIKDIAGNNYAGITGSSTWNFQTVVPTDTTPPTASSFSPTDNATGVAVASNLVVNFSETIQKGTGNIVIKKLSDNSVVETIAITGSNVTASGSQLAINPTNDLAAGTDYYVEIANGAIKDIAGNNYAGITSSSTWNFKTASGLFQAITPDFDSATTGNQTIKAFLPNNSVGVDVNYSTSDNNSSLASSFGFKLHYNSSQLNFVNFTNPLSTPISPIIGSPEADTFNEDNDPLTDKVINVAWLNMSGVAWPNTTFPASLYKANFTTASTYSGTNVNFSSNNTSPGYSFSPTSAVLTLAPPVSLDADGNGSAQGSTDGVLMARYLFGFTGNTLTNGAIGTGATRTTATDIQTYLQNGQTTMLDVDGNGSAQGATDGILIARYLFGFTGNTLTNGAIGTGATRTTATQIQQFLSSYLPPTPNSGNTTIINSGNTQDITASASSESVAPGSVVSVDANYSASDSNPLSSSFGFKLHYDSSKLDFVNFTNPLSTPVAPTIGTPEADTLDEDNDPSTDKVINVAWLNLSGSAWLNAASPTTLYKANFTALPTFTSGSANVNFSSENASPDHIFSGMGTVISADATAPTASSFTPADDATGVAVGDNLVVNFSEAIQKGTGNIVIKKLSDNSVVETIAVTAANITTSGSQVTINPTNDLAAGTDYYVEIANGAIKDIAGNNYEGITGNSAWNFQTVAPIDTTAPTASSFTPTDNATGAAVGANLVVNFSEAIQTGTGNIVIKKLSDNSVVETIAVTGSNVTATGSQLTINPTNDLAQGTDYYIEIANGAIKDIAGNNYAGITGNSAWNFKTQGTSTINGTAGADNLIGTTNPDIINGLEGNDTLNGGAGNDTLVGGLGNDIYVVDNAGDVITEVATQGTDLVQSSVTYTLGTEVENLTLTGTAVINGTGNTLNNTITGNAANNTLNGSTGADTLIGGAGNDIYVVDNAGDVITEVATQGTDLVQSSVTYTLGTEVENLTLTGTAVINGTGNTLNNTITGNAANNTLNGSTGADTLVGGLGNDIYVVDNAGDVITELAAQGTDSVQSSVTYTLGAEAENLILTGTAVINGTGNTLNNTITGNAANNTLNGGTGADTLIGGAGNDIYVVDNAGDIVTEVAAQGTDLVQSSVTYTLGAEVENLTLTGTAVINGTGNALNNTITGNAANNTLNGSTGADTLIGGAGNDIYVVDNAGDIVTEVAAQGTDSVQSSVTYTLGAEAENLILTGTAVINGTGNTLNNTITGNAANNTLNGGTGADTLIGGAGNDIYMVDNALDVITELAAQGTDSVQSSVTYTLGAEAENLILTGTAVINGTGNTLNNTITGNAANNTLNGGAGNDTLNGAAGRDTLTGSTGADNFVFQFGQSTVAACDRITDLAIGTDKIDLLTQAGAAMSAPTSFSRAANNAATTLATAVTQVFTDANGALAGNQALGLNSAALFVATNSGIAGTYLVVNDATAGFQSGNDLVVNITGYTGTLPALGAITPGSFFI